MGNIIKRCFNCFPSSPRNDGQVFIRRPSPDSPPDEVISAEKPAPSSVDEPRKPGKVNTSGRLGDDHADHDQKQIADHHHNNQVQFVDHHDHDQKKSPATGGHKHVMNSREAAEQFKGSLLITDYSVPCSRE
ncbi:hypothetical protein L484_003272 [Morus notabilis]|uniref:Uncharacterized protein n=1 Tax=Morus notabilis TaxID=981085 RepID=W9QQQ0_9ROSA|nr:uncharacterized protein LOC21386813 [Morus notabilis]EXB50796.1 hypothetical protein L484_003272 [Morus notabilis]